MRRATVDTCGGRWASLLLLGATPSDQAIHGALHDVLQRPEFKPQDPNWLNKALLNLFRWLAELYLTNPLLYWLLLIGCLIALVLLVAHLIWTITRVFQTEQGTLASARQQVKDRQRLSASFLETAQQHAGRGEFTEAIRCLFLSLVYRFDEGGRVLFQRTLTNREYLTLFERRPQLQSDLRVFVDTIDSHWYGELPSNSDAYARCLDLYKSVRQRE